MKELKYFFFLFLLVMIGCGKAEKPSLNLDQVEVATKIKRFDKAFYTTKPENLDQLKLEYPYLFPAPNPDSVWVNKMQDKDEQELFAFTQEIYGNFNTQEQELTNLFKHIKYYYPNFKAPEIITILSNVDYNNKVILADSLLFISLDVFLGKDHQVYADFPRYVKQNYTPDHLAVAVAESFVDRIMPKQRHQDFISKIIEEGKKKELAHAFLPHKSEAEILGYNHEQMLWAEQNEAEIWKYFVQNELLFSSDKQLSARFIDDAPFSKFYLELDKESPGRIGVWFGWKIVQAYRKNNEISIQELMQINNEEVFNKSKYKPRKQ